MQVTRAAGFPGEKRLFGYRRGGRRQTDRPSPPPARGRSSAANTHSHQRRVGARSTDRIRSGVVARKHQSLVDSVHRRRLSGRESREAWRYGRTAPEAAVDARPHIGHDGAPTEHRDSFGVLVIPTRLAPQPWGPEVQQTIHPVCPDVRSHCRGPCRGQAQAARIMQKRITRLRLHTRETRLGQCARYSTAHRGLLAASADRCV